MEAYIFTSTLREYLRFRRIAAWIAVLVGVIGLSFLIRYVSPGSTPQDSYVLLSDTIVYRILPLAAAIFSTAVIAQEVEQKTIVYLLTRPVPRWKLLLFKTLAAMVVVFLITLMIAFALRLVVGGAASSTFVGDIPAIAVGAAAYVAVFVFLSLLMNRSMIVTLLFAFVWETSVPNVPGDMYRLTITSYLAGIAHHPAVANAGSGLMDALSGITGADKVTPGLAWASMAVLIAVALISSGYWFSSFEYSPREDAG